MTRPSLPSVIAAVLILVAAALIAAPADAQTAKPKRGGILNSVLTEDPPGLLVHESATISNVWPMSPCYSNLVIFDPLKPLDSAETVILELAEKWSWQDNFRNLVFFLRKNVKWHDGRPFTSADVIDSCVSNVLCSGWEDADAPIRKPRGAGAASSARHRPAAARHGPGRCGAARRSGSSVGAALARQPRSRRPSRSGREAGARPAPEVGSAPARPAGTRVAARRRGGGVQHAALDVSPGRRAGAPHVRRPVSRRPHRARAPHTRLESAET